MNKYLIDEFQKLGLDELNAVLTAQVYLELSEVKKYWNPTYEFNSVLKKVIIRAKKNQSSEFSVFIPIPSFQQLTFLNLQEFLDNAVSKSIFLAIVHPDSTCVYYEVTSGLKEPKDEPAKHLRVNKREKLDAELKRHRHLIEQAALLGNSITIPRERPKNIGDGQVGTSYAEPSDDT